ncbi:MAG: ABC transporter permease [Eubacteriales bacterium]|nr:ABC transporter permease [Eubacteriales bacterium]
MQNSQPIARANVSAFRRFLRLDEVSVTIPLAIIIFITTMIRPDFLTINNFSAMFTQIPFIAVCALGAAFPLMTGNVDISTGRVAGFAGIIMASFICDYGWSTETAILFALACCVIIGLVNGLLVVHLGVPDFVATMGTLYIVGGARYLFIKGYQFALDKVPSYHYGAFFKTQFLGMLPPFWIMIVLFAIAFVVIKKTLWGRRLLATGDNREVAVLAGIPAKQMRMAAYVISAVLSGIAGIMLTLDLGLGLPETGDGWEFRAIAACVVGGVSLSGGKCSPIGILIGVLLVFATENAIIFLGLPTTMRIAVQGALMAFAVLFDIYKQKRKVAA